MLWAEPIIPKEYAMLRVIGDVFRSFRYAKAELRSYIIGNEDKCQDETRGLQDIRPDDCAHTATTGVDPDKPHERQDRYRIRNAECIKGKRLQDKANQIELGSSPKNFGYQEEDCPRLVGRLAEALLEILVYGGDAETIV